MKIAIFIYCCFVVLSSNCSAPPQAASAQRATLPGTAETRVIGSESRLNEQATTLWKSREIALGSQNSLTAIHFSDERHGWIGGASATLYKTDDAGTNWRRITLDVPREMGVQHISFVNEHTGWVVLQKARDPTLEPPQQPTFLLMSTRDGGLRWQSQYRGTNVTVTQLIFSDKENGWLTGVTYQTDSRKSIFILRTRDGGDHWKEVSDELKRVSSTGAANLNEGVMGISSSGPDSAVVITSDLILFSTADQGKNWQRIGSLQGMYGTTDVIRRMGSGERGRLWNIGGSNSAHSGTRGVLFVEQDDHSWVKQVLGNVFFSDAISLSQNRFLAAGLLARSIELHGTYRATNEAVVLISTDGGKNWGVVYHNPRITSVNCIYIVNDSLAWAAGNAGLVLKLEDLH
jgi:photosystem II stability/assembly factor-like uncharacterized protein